MHIAVVSMKVLGERRLPRQLSRGYCRSKPASDHRPRYCVETGLDWLAGCDQADSSAYDIPGKPQIGRAVDEATQRLPCGEKV